MIRLIVHTADAGMAANIGGPVQSTFTTFDIDRPDLEKLLTSTSNSYVQSFLVGCQVIPTKSEAPLVETR